MAYNIKLEGSNLREAESLLKEIAIILENQHITYWIEGGTLLGIHREQRLLPWDNDLDISMMDDQLSKVGPFINALKRKGYRIRIRRFTEDSAPFKKGMIRIIKVRRRRFLGLIRGKVCLDIFIKYPKENFAFWLIDGKTKAVPLAFYRAFRTITFQGKDYSAPAATDDYLTYRYGDWKTQKKDWDTSTDDNALA